MRTQAIGRTPLSVSRIAYGCMGLGGRDPNAAMTAVRAALDHGITCFDHADIYGGGEAERVFSRLWAEVPGARDRIVLESKCGIRFPDQPAPGDPKRYDFSYGHIVGSVEGCLARLGTDRLDLMLLHRPDALVEPDEVARALDDLAAAGKVLAFGVSNHTAAQIELLQRSVRQPLVVNQVEINPLRCGLVDAGIAGGPGLGTLEYCRMHGITLQAWSPLAKGVLSDVAEGGDERTRTTRAVVVDIARHHGVGTEAILVAWLLRHPAHIQPVIGTVHPGRMAAACTGDDIELTREEWYRIFNAGRGEEVP